MLATIFIGMLGLLVGIHGVRALREMLRGRRASILFDWRRIFGKVAVYDRNIQKTPYWLTIFLNAFLIVIAWCFAIGVGAIVVLTGFVKVFSAK
jgi:hypothetical protein